MISPDIHIPALASLILRKLTVPTTRLHWIYLLSALLMAAYVHRGLRKAGEHRTFLAYLLPRRVWLHRSAVTDYFFIALTQPLWLLLVVPHLLSASQVSGQILGTLSVWTGAASGTLAPSVGVAVFYSATLVIANDLKLYWVHRMMHRVPLLWEFHKVHHSAEVLTPISFYRSHPVDNLVQALMEALVTGAVTAAFLFAFPGELAPFTILGVNAFRFAFYVGGANLRHSHVWLSFGSALEHWIISPAQHQIHHSANPKHFDRNFGSEFAVWDWMFGTLYVASRREELILGLGPEENRRLQSVWQLLSGPFIAVWKSKGAIPRAT